MDGTILGIAPVWVAFALLVLTYAAIMLDRILRTGTLVIESAAQDPLEFDDIPGVERVHSLLYREVFGQAQ